MTCPVIFVLYLCSIQLISHFDQRFKLKKQILKGN